VSDGADESLAGDLPLAAERLELAMAAAGFGWFDWLVREDHVVLDDRACELFGFDPATFDHRVASFWKALHAEDRPGVEEAVSAALDSCSTYVAEYRVVLPGGSVRGVEARGRGGAGAAGQLDLSLGFIKSMLDQSMTWAQGGHIPAWQPVAQSDAFKKLTPQSNYAAAADAAVYDPPGWYSGSGSDFEIIMGSAIGAVEAGQMAPDAAIAQIRSKLSALATTASPV
jgi:hypothetical protein